ncbi:MAG: pirin family protein [Aeromicrobium erythreum]
MRELRRGTDRFETRRDGIVTRHSFSYGDHYDPANVGFGPLLAINEERLPPGGGYAAHRHADVEIVTWVLEGVLAHEDTTGHGGEVRPGTAQRLSAGSGAEHVERNGSTTAPLRFVQMMLASRHDAEPAYAVADVPAGAGVHPTVPVHAEAELLVVRPGGAPVDLPRAARLLLHVTRGAVVVDGGTLGPGDELRVVDEPVVVAGSGEALVWLLRS